MLRPVTVDDSRAEAGPGSSVWVLRVAGGAALIAAVRMARWNGPRSQGLPASDLFVALIGALVLGAVIAIGYGLRRRRSAWAAGLPAGVGATVDGAAAVVIAGLAGSAYLFATLDFPKD